MNPTTSYIKIIGARAALLIVGLIPTTLGLVTTAQAAFVHPGVLSRQSDLDRMKTKVAANEQPWLGGWNNLVANTFSQSSHVPRPVAIVVRGCGTNCVQNYTSCMQDAAAAYQNALRYHISGNTAHANCAVNILNAWSDTMTSISTCCSDHALLAGIQGYQFAAAGELMRNYSGWAASDVTQFKNWMKTVWYSKNNAFLTDHLGACVSHYWNNWDAANMASMISIGVLCDDQAIFDKAVNYYRSGVGNGALNQAVPVRHGAGLGQWQESGRDQDHSKMGIGITGAFLEVAWNQGVDLYAYTINGKSFFDGMEYVARYNLGNTVPYSNYNNCDNVNQAVISATGRGIDREFWDMVYNAYRRKGITVPYTAQAATQLRPDWGAGHENTGASWAFDHAGFTTLTHTIDTSSGFPAAGTYSLRNRSSGLMLDNLGVATNGADVSQWGDGTSNNQRWVLSYVSANVVKLQCVTGNLFLDSLGRTTNGSIVGQWQDGTSNNQRWTIINAGGGYFKLKNVATGLCLDVGGNPWPNGDDVQQYTDGTSQNQHWQFVAP